MAVLVVVLRSDGLARMNPLRRDETSACAPIKIEFRCRAGEERQLYIAGKGHVCTAYKARYTGRVSMYIWAVDCK